MFKREIETGLYQKEITTLKKQVHVLTTKLEDANKYKREYQSLCSQYKRDLNELNIMKEKTEQLHHELKDMISQLEHNKSEKGV